MYTVYGMSLSGNCYKVRLLLELLKQPYTWRAVNTRDGETHTPEFLKLNPDGKIPVLQLENGDTLPESNAILYYLAEGTSYLPADGWQRAQALRWMFFEQYSHEPYIAVNRALFLFRDPTGKDDLIQANLEKGYAALDVMERQLQSTAFLIGDRMSIADISLYAYTHVASDGKFDLQKYTAIGAWMERITRLPGYVAMTAPIS